MYVHTVYRDLNAVLKDCDSSKFMDIIKDCGFKKCGLNDNNNHYVGGSIHCVRKIEQTSKTCNLAFFRHTHLNPDIHVRYVTTTQHLYIS